MVPQIRPSHTSVVKSRTYQEESGGGDDWMTVFSESSSDESEIEIAHHILLEDSDFWNFD